MVNRMIAVSLVAGLLLAALLPAAAVLGNEERAAGPVKAPKWAVNDRWKWDMDKTVRYVNPYTDVNGTLTITYTEDDQLIIDTVEAVEGSKYRMAFTEFEYLNGSYHFVPSSYGQGMGWLESNGTIKATFDKSGVRYRNASDFSLVNATLKMAYRYGSQRLDGNYRVFNWSGNETHSLTTDSPLNSLRFPFTPGDSWNVDTNLTDVYQGVKEWPDYPQWGAPAYSGSRYDHYEYSVSVAAQNETKVVPAGTFDCYKLTDSGVDEWGWTEGTDSNHGSASYGQTRWWSRLAGITVDTNDTTMLESYAHVANLAPYIDVIPTQVINEDLPFSMALAPFAHDPDIVNDTGDFLTYNATCTPQIPTFEVNDTTGNLTVMPTQEQVGAHLMTLTVMDTFGLKATRSFNLNVANVNDPPYVASPMANLSVYENVSFETDIFLNKVFSDPDPSMLDSLSFGVSGNGSVQAIISDTTKVTFVSPDLYAPAAPLIITFTARDTGSGNASAVMEASTILNLTVIHRDHKPFAVITTDMPAVTMDEDTTNSDLDLANYFQDVDIAYAGDSLNYSFSGNWTIAVALIGGKATLSPAHDWNGDQNITFMATDTGGLSASKALGIKVLPVNDAPVILANGTSPWSLSIELNEAQNGTLSEQRFTVNATDVDGDKLTIGWTVTDSSGKKVGEAKGTPFVLRTAYAGDMSSTGSPYTVSVLVTDGKLNASRNWTVTVLNVNRKPAAAISAPADGAKFVQGKAVLLDGSKSTDPDQAQPALAYEWTSSLNGKLGTGAILNLTSLRKGTHNITLTVTDPDGGSSSASIMVSIVAKPAVNGKGFIPGFGPGLLLAALAVTGVLIAGKRTQRRN